MPNNYTLYKNSFPSTDGSSKISGFMCMPNHRTPRSVVQIVNQIGKSFSDYGELTEYLTGQGYVVCGHDHLGTGESLADGNTAGYFGERYGKKILVDDTRRMTALIRQNIEGLSVIMTGEGIGAAIAETLIAEDGNVADGYILLDPPRADSFTRKLRRISKRRSRFSGENRFGGLIVKKIEKRQKKALKKKGVSVESFESIPSLTYRGFYDVFSLIAELGQNSKTEYGKKDIPLLVVNSTSKAENPCDKKGNEVYNHYLSNHFTDVRMALSECGTENEVLQKELCKWLNEKNY